MASSPLPWKSVVILVFSLTGKNPSIFQTVYLCLVFVSMWCKNSCLCDGGIEMPSTTDIKTGVVIKGEVTLLLGKDV